MNKTKFRQYRAAYLFLLPTLIGLILFRVYPIGNAVLESLYSSYYQSGKMVETFTGFGNYIDLFNDPIFWKSLYVTLKFTLIIVPLQIFLALFLALLLTRKKSGVSVFRSLYMIPIGISPAISAVIWRTLLDPNEGVVNGILTGLGFSAQPFFTSSSQALWCIMLVASWRGIMYWMIFLVAGLKDIPKQLYEASKIDGANLLQQTFKITLPLLKRVLLFVVVVNTSANFLLFSPIYIITSGGPSDSTNVLMLEAYKSGFIYNNMGRAMSITIILIFIMLVLIAIQFRFLRSDADV